jgi:predicted Zn-dependent protease
LLRYWSVIVICCALVAPAPALAQNDIAARAAQGAAAMEAGNFADAAQIYAEVAKARPSDAGLQMNLGMARYMSGDPADALPSLERALKLDPSLAPASLFYGAALLDLDRAKEAIGPLQRAVKAMPKNTEAREMLARAELATERYVSAATEYRALTTMAPKDPKSWYGLAQSYQGMAEEAFQALQAKTPDSPLIELLLGDVLVSQHKFPQAVQTYRSALARDPGVGGVHESIAEVYELAGKLEWAAAERAKVTTKGPCTATKAECEFLAGNARTALAAARQDATRTGLYWVVRSANVLATEALAQLESLPASVELHLIRAQMAQTSSQHTAAVEELRTALEMQPGDPAIEGALAEALVAARNFTDALPLLERLTRERRDDPSLLFLYGSALLDSQQIERALPLLERVATMDPAMLPAQAALGRAYVQAGQFEKAVAPLQAAAETDQDGSLHYQLARALQAAGRTEEAKAALAVYQEHQAAGANPDLSERPVELGPPE